MNTISKKIKNVNSVAVYENLHFGGASVIANLTTKYISKRLRVKKYSDSDIKPRNFLHYLLITLLHIPLRQYALAKEIDKNNQILLAQHSWLMKSPLLLSFSKLPKIYVCHEGLREYYDQEHKKLQNLKEKIVNILRLHIKLFDRLNLKSKNLIIIVNSYYSKKQIDSAYKINSHVIYPGIDVNIYKSVGKHVKPINQIISIGAINKLKNQLHIINSVSKIPISIRPKVLLIGNEINEKYYKNLCDSAKRNNVLLEIKKNISERAIPKYLKSSLAFVYCPINEPFGVVIEEAMASGTPLIVYKYGGGYIEILTDKNGIIIDNLDPEIWASAIQKIIEDKSIRRKFSIYNQSTKMLNRISYKRMGDKLMKIIQQQLKNTSP